MKGYRISLYVILQRQADVAPIPVTSKVRVPSARTAPALLSVIGYFMEFSAGIEMVFAVLTHPAHPPVCQA